MEKAKKPKKPNFQKLCWWGLGASGGRSPFFWKFWFFWFFCFFLCVFCFFPVFAFVFLLFLLFPYANRILLLLLLLPSSGSSTSALEVLKFLQRYSVCRCAKADSTLGSSQAVPHPSTNRALRRLTLEVGRDPMYSTRYGRQRDATRTHKKIHRRRCFHCCGFED